jgi:hypothetical protein
VQLAGAYVAFRGGVSQGGVPRRRRKSFGYKQHTAYAEGRRAKTAKNRESRYSGDAKHRGCIAAFLSDFLPTSSLCALA